MGHAVWTTMSRGLVQCRVLAASGEHDKRIAGVGAAFVLMLTPAAVRVAGAHHGPDSMFPTANLSPACVDGGMGSPFCRTDNNTLTYGSEGSVPGAQQGVVVNVMNGEYNPTDFNTSQQVPIAYTGNFETDTVAQVSANLPAGLDGITWCDDSISSTVCDQHYVRFRTANVMNNTGLVCHESGTPWA